MTYSRIQNVQSYLLTQNSYPYTFVLLSFNLGFLWHEICPLAQIAIFIKKFLANQEGIFHSIKNQS